MELEKRSLGQSGINVSCLGLGTVKFGRNHQVRYPEKFSLPSLEELEGILNRTRELGINFLDTAPAYGDSEEKIGHVLRGRSDWIICTKVGEDFANGQSSFNFSGSHAQKSIQRSLKNLKTDYLDIVLVHSNGDDETIIDNTDCLETLARLKEKGIIRAYGMSTKTIQGGIRATDLTDVVMVTLNPSNKDDLPVIKNALSKNKGVLVKKALNSGHLSEYSLEKNLNFVLSTSGVTSIVVGTINQEHLAVNVSIINRFSSK
tara:strand:+ start:36 stop:815 length:780 start_codon:yes stop_codon:yes gene_type:complete